MRCTQTRRQRRCVSRPARLKSLFTAGRRPAIELPAPKRLDLGEPIAHRRESSGLQPVQAHTSIAVRLVVGDEAAFAQHAQVTTERRRAHVQRAGEFTGAMRSHAQQVDDSEARRIAERGEGFFHSETSNGFAAGDSGQLAGTTQTLREPPHVALRINNYYVNYRATKKVKVIFTFLLKRPIALSSAVEMVIYRLLRLECLCPYLAALSA